MSDYTLPPCSTLLCGMTGSGKTTFALRYLQNVAAACRFIFDDLGQCAARLKLPHASTAAELEAALGKRWVIFNPHRMFPGDTAGASRFFCQWAYDCSRRGPGKKVLMVDELGADRAAVQGLPLGSYAAWNRLSRARLDGRVF